MYVRGTRDPFPLIGPTCRYEALFDVRPEFDALRLSFLISADPRQLIETFVTKLQSLVSESIETLSERQRQRCFDFLERAVAWGNLHAPVLEPPNFASRAWPAYLACIKNSNYYFSVAEVVVTAAGVGRNIAVFKSINSNLIYEAGYFDGRGPITVIKLLADNMRRVRSHFERLLTAPRADALVATLQADKEARRAEQRREREREAARREEERRQAESAREEVEKQIRRNEQDDPRNDDEGRTEHSKA